MSVQIIVIMNKVEFNFDENLEAGQLKSGLEKRGVENELTYINSYNLKSYEEFLNPDAKIYAFAISDTNINDVYSAIKQLKSLNKKSVVCVFDAIAIYNRRNIIDNNLDIDFIPLGEPEELISYVYNRLDENNSLIGILEENNNLYSRYLKSSESFKRRSFENYNWPCRKNLKERDVIIAHIASSYGCPYKCSFCTMPQVDNTVVFRNTDDLMNELISVYKNNNIRLFHFVDSTIEGYGKDGKERLKDLCTKIINYPVKFGFRAFIRASNFKEDSDIEYLRILKSSGFRNLFVGIESGSNHDLKIYNKNTNVDTNNHFLNMCKEIGLKPFYGFMMINPFSTEESIIENYNFLVKHKSDQFSHFSNCLKIYSNTKMFEQLKQNNLLYSNYDYKGSDYQYNCMNGNINEIKKYLEDHFIRDKVLQEFNSHYHNFIFLKNYMDSVDIKNSVIDEKCNKISEQIFNLNKEFFYHLYINKDFQYCNCNLKLFKNSLIDVYKEVIPLREKLLKSYLRQQLMSEVKYE